MDKQEILALLNEAISAAKEEIIAEAVRRDQGVASNFKSQLKGLIPAKEEIDIEALKGELETERKTRKALEQKIAEGEQNRLMAERNSVISEVVASSGTVSPKALQKLFTVEYGDKLTKLDNEWGIKSEKDGFTPINKVMETYLGSDEGQLFMPPSGVNGSGSTETLNNTRYNTQSNSDALADAFLNLI